MSCSMSQQLHAISCRHERTIAETDLGRTSLVALRVRCLWLAVVFFIASASTMAIGADDPEKLDPKLACYGIEVEVFSSTNDPPTVWITGASSQDTKEYVLEHSKTHSWEAGKTDYFLIPAEKVGNVGIPTAVSFQASGGDDVRFKVITVDYFAKEGWNMTYLCSAKDNLNRRDQSLHNAPKLHEARVAYVKINQTCALDSDNSIAEGIRHTDMKVTLKAPVDVANIAISPASKGWIDIPLNTISKISLVLPGSNVKTSLGDSVAARLLTAEENTKTKEQSYTKSVQAEFKSKSEVHENTYTFGFSSTQAESVTNAISKEMEKTMEETSTWEIGNECPPTEDGYVRFAITEDYMRVRRHPRSISVDDKVLYFQERRDYGVVNYSEAYKVNSPELKAKWKQYTQEIKNGDHPGVVLSKVQFNLHVGN